MRPSALQQQEKTDPRRSKRDPLADAFDQLDFEYVTGVAEKAMRAVTEQRVPPTPDNFHVWFKYALGIPVELKRTIDILLAGKRKFDKATNRDLYTTYVGSQRHRRRGRPSGLPAIAFGAGVGETVSEHGHCRQPHADARRSAMSPANRRPASIRGSWSRP